MSKSPAAADRLLCYKQVRHFNEPGHAHFLTFSCYERMRLLSNDLWRGWLAGDVRDACAKHAFALWAYVFMPDHVHLLVKPRSETYDTASFLKSAKQGSARRILGHLRSQGSGLLDRLRVHRGARGEVLRFWQTGPGYDKNIWDMEKAVEKARYCHRNPVTRRLVTSPEQWRWSSFRWLELGRRSGEPLIVDDWIESPQAGPNDEGRHG